MIHERFVFTGGRVIVVVIIRSVERYDCVTYELGKTRFLESEEEAEE